MSVSDEFMSFLDDLKKKSFMRVLIKIWFVSWYCFVYFAIFPPKVIYRKGALKTCSELISCATTAVFLENETVFISNKITWTKVKVSCENNFFVRNSSIDTHNMEIWQKITPFQQNTFQWLFLTWFTVSFLMRLQCEGELWVLTPFLNQTIHHNAISFTKFVTLGTRSD